jgi:hypothetical protein
MVKGQDRPEKESYLLVTFYSGEGLANQNKYTNFEQTTEGFPSEPRMEVEMPENTGTFDRHELRIWLPYDTFTNRVGSGVPHSPLFVRIEEVTNGLFPGDQSTRLVLYRGRVMHTQRNFQKRPNTVAFFCLPAKALLDIPLGLPCNHHCVWTLFKGGCGASEARFDLQTEIDSVDGQEVTITDTAVTTPGRSDARYWKRGYMEKDGLQIGIREYDGDTDFTKFYMDRRVPTDWIGGTNDIRIVPGCDKTIENCRSRFNQEETFGGAGYGIPPYQPNIESPQ